MNELPEISSLLIDKNATSLDSIQEELSQSWTKQQVFRTETEARFCVLNSSRYPTKASQYWQAVREQMVHLNEYINLSFDLRRKNIELLEIESKIATAQGFEKDRLEVDRDEMLFHLKSGDQVAKHRIREILQWSTLKQEVNDGSFDDIDPNTHQRESLFKSVLNRAQVAPADLSSEERLSMEGLLRDLSKQEVNKELVDMLTSKNRPA